MRPYRIANTVAVLVLAGCTSTPTIQRITPGANATGYPYQLRFTQFDVAVTWRVIGCQPGPNPLKFKISAEAKDKAPLDPAHAYMIDPGSLQGPFRTTEFSMDWYEDRGVKTINSSVDDQTGTAIVSALTGVAKLAGAGLLPFGANEATCPDAVVAALRAIDGVDGGRGQEAITKSAQRAVDDQTLALTRLTARVALAGAGVDDATRRELDQALRLGEVLAASLTAEQAKLKSLIDVVSDTRTVKWPANGSEFASPATSPLRPSAAAAKRWQLATTSKGVEVHLALLAPTVAGTGGTSLDGRAPAMTGLPYREPRAMRLHVCTGDPCPTAEPPFGADETAVPAIDVQVLQAGSLMYLPFRARTFASIKNSAGFSQGGVLISAGSSQSRGAGSGVAEAFKGGAEQVAGIAQGDRTYKAARLQARIDEAKARKALADAEAALVPSPNAADLAAIQAFQTDATLASAERTMIEAQSALDAARALRPD